MHFWGDGMGLMWIFGGLFSLLFFIAIIALIFWAVKQLGRRSGGSTIINGTGSVKEPMDIARERYAKGEISREEFEQIKKDLS